MIGFQMDPQFRERQREQQKSESKAANTVVDLREKIKAGKRAREATGQVGNRVRPVSRNPCLPHPHNQK